MYSRRRLLLAGLALLAGCQGEESVETTQTDTPSPTATPTATATETPTATTTQTETRTETPELTGPEHAAATIDDAEAALQRGHERYLNQASETATSLTDVGAETTGFEESPVTLRLDAAREHLSSASETANGPQSLTITELRLVAGWLGEAARVQSAQSRVAEALIAASTAGERDEGFTAVRDHLDAVIDRMRVIDNSMRQLSSPEVETFGAIDAITGNEVRQKYQQFQREHEGMQQLERRLDQTGEAIGTLSSAFSYYNADNYERAEREASFAIDYFDEIDGAATEIEPESLGPTVDLFREALEPLRDRAVQIRTDARAEQS